MHLVKIFRLKIVSKILQLTKIITEITTPKCHTMYKEVCVLIYTTQNLLPLSSCYLNVFSICMIFCVSTVITTSSRKTNGKLHCRGVIIDRDGVSQE